LFPKTNLKLTQIGFSALFEMTTKRFLITFGTTFVLGWLAKMLRIFALFSNAKVFPSERDRAAAPEENLLKPGTIRNCGLCTKKDVKNSIYFLKSLQLKIRAY